jgi:hypothetical protein
MVSSDAVVVAMPILILYLPLRLCFYKVHCVLKLASKEGNGTALANTTSLNCGNKDGSPSGSSIISGWERQLFQ